MAQYPNLVVASSATSGTTVPDAAAQTANVQTLLVAVAAGMVLIVPATVALFRVIALPPQKGHSARTTPNAAGE